MYRIDPDDNVDLVVNLPSGWIPNLNFGSGVGGWDDHKIYVSDLTEDRVFELDPGTWGINVPHIP